MSFNRKEENTIIDDVEFDVTPKRVGLRINDELVFAAYDDGDMTMFNKNGTSSEQGRWKK